MRCRYGAPKLSRPHASALAERLAEKIEKDLGLVCDPSTFCRTYAGSWQRARGAVVWTMKLKNSPLDIGSGEPASECVKNKYRLCLIEDGYGEISTELIEKMRKD